MMLRRVAVSMLVSFLATGLHVVDSHAEEKKPMKRWIDEGGFHTLNGDRFWSRPLYGPNRRSLMATGELPHAAFVWFGPQGRACVRCGHFLPGVVTERGTKWLYEASKWGSHLYLSILCSLQESLQQ